MSKKERLFDQFPPVTTEKWMEKITADLKGADFFKKLVWKTREGLEVMPFYRQENTENLNFINALPGEYPFVRGTRSRDNEWLVRQDIRVADYREANRKALELLMNGVSSLGFIIENPETISAENITLLLKDIQCDCIELNFNAEGKAKELLYALREALKVAGVDTQKITGCIGAEPLTRLLTNGKLCVTIDEGLGYLASLAKDASDFPGLRTVQVSGSQFSNAGAGVVMELAYSLALGNEYMSALTSRGLTPEEAASKIKFSFGIGSDFFPECAKLRAARMLWAIIVRGYKPGNETCEVMNIHSVTGRWNKTLYDPYVNMLRTQTEAMSAVVGGADSITVEPFDVVFADPDEFSERIARNQQLLLLEESHLGKVADPGAGSYYIENLTQLIAEKAWKLFIEIEEAGGFLEAVKKGTIQKSVKSATEERKADVAKRKEILLGTNQYPNFNEKLTGNADIKKAFSEKAAIADAEVDIISSLRGATRYEKLRYATEESGRRPIVYMLTIGNQAMRKARSQFASNFFACSGYEVIDNNGFVTAAEGVKAALEAKADIIVVCSSDDEYVVFAPEVLKATAGKALVVVAGNPASADDLKAAGIEYFISLKSNVLETLQMFSDKLGIKREE
jgi:methylmalonyl-CoA mutase